MFNSDSKLIPGESLFALSVKADDSADSGQSTNWVRISLCISLLLLLALTVIFAVIAILSKKIYQFYNKHTELYIITS